MRVARSRPQRADRRRRRPRAGADYADRERGAKRAKFTKMPRQWAVGTAQHERLVLLKFDDDPPYGLDLEVRRDLVARGARRDRERLAPEGTRRPIGAGSGCRKHRRRPELHALGLFPWAPDGRTRRCRGTALAGCGEGPHDTCPDLAGARPVSIDAGHADGPIPTRRRGADRAAAQDAACAARAGCRADLPPGSRAILPEPAARHSTSDGPARGWRTGGWRR